jgi:ADP-ribose pyrophosphatase
MKKVINVVAAILKKDSKIFIAERGYGEFKGMYEFPGGKIEVGEKPQDALKRELKEEIQANVEIDYFFYHVHYEYPNFILEMDCYVCHLLDSHVALLEHTASKWIDPNEENIIWVPADIEVIEEIRKRGI